MRDILEIWTKMNKMKSSKKHIEVAALVTEKDVYVTLTLQSIVG
jgi:hypothetical protein